MRSIFLILLLAGTVLNANGGDRVFESGAQRVHLIELFTSQGCSSCPPAEDWMSKLKAEPRLWKNFVPVAFHVDYWDRLGWRDPFAAKEWTERQYRYSEAWNGESVYTPAFVLDGREWRDPSIPSASNDQGSGVLKITFANRKATAEFNPTNGQSKNVDLHLALLGFDLNTKVAAGENSGQNLHQDFVVLSRADGKLLNGKGKLEFKNDSRAGAIAAWITAPNAIEPIQAVGGWLK